MKYSHVIYNMDVSNSDTRHPEEVFKSLGIKYDSYQPNSYQECWHLMGVTNMPNPIPPHFTIVKE